MKQVATVGGVGLDAAPGVVLETLLGLSCETNHVSCLIVDTPDIFLFAAQAVARRICDCMLVSIASMAMNISIEMEDCTPPIK